MDRNGMMGSLVQDTHMGMGHSGMDHGGHDMQCSMMMVWNTQTRGICVVFPSWKVNSSQSLTLTLIALFSLAALLEYLRFRLRRYDASLISKHNLSTNLLTGLLSRGNADQHRRKASVQSVLGVNGRHYTPAKSTSIGGPMLTTNASGVGLGDRRASPTISPPDSGSASSRSDDDAPLLPGGIYNRSRKPPSPLGRFVHAVIPVLPISRFRQVKRASLYVLVLALSMFLMLVFMTYNAWLIAAVLLGAGAGHYLFNRDIGLGFLSEDKAVCH